MEENTRQGFNTGGIAPFGYRKHFLPHPAKTLADRGKRKALLDPDPDQAPVVERIFREFVFGRQTIRGMADELNRDGVPSARGGPWTGAAISGILDNPKYTGYQVSNRRRRKTAGNRANLESEWIWSETLAHPPIVSLELWRAAQELRRRPDTEWRRRPKSGRPGGPCEGWSSATAATGWPQFTGPGGPRRQCGTGNVRSARPGSATTGWRWRWSGS
jgi:hypothetical protein